MTDKQAVLTRLPKSFAEWLKDRASKNHRSVSAEVLAIIEDTMNASKQEALK